MKNLLAIASALGLLACSLSLGQAQDTSSDPSPSAPHAVVEVPAATPAPGEPVAPPAETAAATTESAPAEGTPAPAEPAVAAPFVEVVPAIVESPEVDASSAVIPLIQFQDVALTTAIENLARQAGLNYILDPKVTFGQIGPDGKPSPQPTINLRWEQLTAEQALMALLTVYNLQLVDDPKTSVSRITIKDPAAPDPLVTKVVQLRHTSPSNVMAAVQGVFWDEKKRSKVITDVRTSQLVVVATEKEQLAVEFLLEKLDLPTKQVLIEAKILETTVNPKTVKGVDWSGTLRNQNVVFGNGITRGIVTKTTSDAATTTTTPSGRILPSSAETKSTGTVLDTLVGDGGVTWNTMSGFSPETGFLNADGLSVALSFLNESGDTKVISEPRLVTLDNMKATIDVGLMYPIVNVQASTANTTGGSQIAYSNLTVNLDVTPRITANDIIEMRILQSVVRLGPQFQSTVAGVDNVVDSFFSRRIETGVLIPSGNTLVMGGLISDELRNSNTKVPFMGDIPVLGMMFRKDSKERNRGNLMVFLTPTIVRDTDYQPSQSTFLKSTGKEEVKEEWTAWDSGKPRDWSKPKGQTVTD